VCTYFDAPCAGLYEIDVSFTSNCSNNSGYHQLMVANVSTLQIWHNCANGYWKTYHGHCVVQIAAGATVGLQAVSTNSGTHTNVGANIMTIRKLQ
jgi:hypothetical protein